MGVFEWMPGTNSMALCLGVFHPPVKGQEINKTLEQEKALTEFFEIIIALHRPFF
jgi:hypothetical protein